MGMKGNVAEQAGEGKKMEMGVPTKQDPKKKTNTKTKPDNILDQIRCNELEDRGILCNSL